MGHTLHTQSSLQLRVYIIHSMYCNGKKCNSSQRAVVLCSYLVSLSCNSRTKINMRFVTDWFNSQWIQTSHLLIACLMARCYYKSKWLSISMFIIEWSFYNWCYLLVWECNKGLCDACLPMWPLIQQHCML